MKVTLTFKDDQTSLVPGALAWLKESERMLNEELAKRQIELMAYGSVRIGEVS